MSGKNGIKKTREITSHWEDLRIALLGIGLNPTGIAIVEDMTFWLLRNHPAEERQTAAANEFLTARETQIA